MKHIALPFLLLLLSFPAIIAQENITPESNQTIPSENTAQSTPEPAPAQTPPPLPAPPPSPPPVENPQQPSPPKQEPARTRSEPVKLVTDFRMSRVFPKEVKIGENQLNIEITNIGSAPIEHLSAIVSGKGIGVTNVVPIDRLDPGQQGYIIAFFTATTGGTIPLSIRVQNKEFVSSLKVIDINQGVDVVKKKQEELARKKRAEMLGEKLDNLTHIYEQYDHEYIERKTQGFVFEELNFRDAKQYLREAQAGLAKDDLLNADASLQIVETELLGIRSKLDAGAIPKKTFAEWARDNLAVIATSLSIIVATFAIVDNIKKHRQIVSGLVGTKQPKQPRKKSKKPDSSRKTSLRPTRTPVEPAKDSPSPPTEGISRNP